jgi:hypothetical protein
VFPKALEARSQFVSFLPGCYAQVLNPDSAVEREVMSKEQTFRSILEFEICHLRLPKGM